MFSSGLFEEHGVTLSDLRWHLANCAACNASMDEAEAQLRRFDESRLTTLNDLLKSFLDLLENGLERLRLAAENAAEDIAEAWLDHQRLPSPGC